MPRRLFNVRLSDAERVRLTQAAAVNHQTRSDFARDAITTAADDCLEDRDRLRVFRPDCKTTRTRLM